MAVLFKTVLACAFVLLTVSGGQTPSVNKNNINQHEDHAREPISNRNIAREDKIEKITQWLNDVNQIGTVISNETMQPIFDLQGASELTKSNAAIVMELDTLPRLRRTAYFFGDTLIVNDAIAKAGTSRETHTPDSEHFSGRAVDISVKGMTNEEKLRLFESALKAGFTGFGFGKNILHVDTGRIRWWAYGNSTYGGVAISDLGAIVKKDR